MAIGIAEVSLVSIFVECILYGFFTFVFAVSVYVLLLRRRRKREPVNRRMLIVSIVMFILATVHVAADLRRLLNAYIDEPDATAYLSEVNTAIYSLKSTAYCMQTLVGDGFMLYRLYLIYGGDKRIYLPILVCFVASIGVGIGALQGFARASPTAPVFITELHDWIVSFFSLTLFTNFSCTLLIAARILWIHKRVSGAVSGGTNVFPAAMIIIESGSVYSACLILLLSLYLSGSFSQYIVLDGVTQVIGVVFSLIIVRVGLGLSTDAATYVTASRASLSTFAAAGPAGPAEAGGAVANIGKKKNDKYIRSGVRHPLYRENPRPARPVTLALTQMSGLTSTGAGTDTTTLSIEMGRMGVGALGMDSLSSACDAKLADELEGGEYNHDGKDGEEAVEEMEYAENANLELRDRVRV